MGRNIVGTESTNCDRPKAAARHRARKTATRMLALTARTTAGPASTAMSASLKRLAARSVRLRSGRLRRHHGNDEANRCTSDTR